MTASPQDIFINGGVCSDLDDWRLMPGSCDRCGSPLIQIDHCGDRLTGCPACNVWRGDKSAFIVELAVEDWEALGKLRESVKWTLRPRAKLRREWRWLYRTELPRISRDLLIRGIGYRRQEIQHGSLGKSTRRKLRTLAKMFRTEGRVAPDPGLSLKPGARLVREWHGRTHTVTVTEDGFEYAGTTYQSLTKIAKKITGAHWSGPRFFGLVRVAPSRERDGGDNG